MERDTKIFLGVIFIILVAMVYYNFDNSSDSLTGDFRLFGRVIGANKLPDLFVSYVTVLDSSNHLIRNSANINTLLNIKFQIRNAGTGSASTPNSAKNRLNIKKDGTTVFNNDYVTANTILNSGQSANVISVPFTFTSVGQYCIEVKADALNGVQESKENNNILSYGCVNVAPTCTASDWSCTSFGPTTCPASGTQIRTCSKTTNCLTDAGKPSESQSCTYISNIDLTFDNSINPINYYDFRDINGNSITVASPGDTVVPVLGIKNNGLNIANNFKVSATLISNYVWTGALFSFVRNEETFDISTLNPGETKLIKLAPYQIPTTGADPFLGITGTIDTNNVISETNENNNWLSAYSGSRLTIKQYCTFLAWQCSAWDPVICPSSQTQTRICSKTPTSNCFDPTGTTGKPAESQFCTYLVSTSDLIVQDAQFTDLNGNVITTTTVGTSFIAKTSIKNQGTVTASGIQGREIYNSINIKKGGSIYISRLTRPSVYSFSPGEVKSLSSDSHIFNFTGAYCLDVTADVQNYVVESNENNNVLLNAGCVTVT